MCCGFHSTGGHTSAVTSTPVVQLRGRQSTLISWKSEWWCVLMVSKLQRPAVTYQQELPLWASPVLLFQLSHYDPVLAAPAWRPAQFCHNPGEDWVLHSGIGVHSSQMRWVERALLEKGPRQARTRDKKAALHYCSRQSRETDASLGPVARTFTPSGGWSFLSFTAERRRLTHAYTTLQTADP